MTAPIDDSFYRLGCWLAAANAVSEVAVTNSKNRNLYGVQLRCVWFPGVGFDGGLVVMATDQAQKSPRKAGFVYCRKSALGQLFQAPGNSFTAVGRHRVSLRNRGRRAGGPHNFPHSTLRTLLPSLRGRSDRHALSFFQGDGKFHRWASLG